MQKHTLTLIDSNFDEKYITLNHEQLVALNDCLNVYLKNSIRSLLKIIFL